MGRLLGRRGANMKRIAGSVVDVVYSNVFYGDLMGFVLGTNKQAVVQCIIIKFEMHFRKEATYPGQPAPGQQRKYVQAKRMPRCVFEADPLLCALWMWCFVSRGMAPAMFPQVVVLVSKKQISVAKSPQIR